MPEVSESAPAATTFNNNAADYVPDFAKIKPVLRPFPAFEAPSIPIYPGQMEGPSFVRRTEVVNPGATKTVYVHGMGGYSGNWTDLMYLLAPSSAGIALDLPAYGRTPPPNDGKYSLNRNASAVIELIEQEGADPVHLVGNSLGGITSVLAAARRPDLVKSLILVSPAMLTRASMAVEHLPTAWKMLMSARRMKSMDPREIATEQSAAVMALCLSAGGSVPPDRFEETIVENMRRNELEHNQAVAAGSARTLFEAAAQGENPRSIWNVATEVAAPTLIFMGVQDHLVPIDLAPKIAASFAGGEMVVWPDNGHIAMQEHPLRTATRILQWWAARGLHA